jgi:hypothetical protein
LTSAAVTSSACSCVGMDKLTTENALKYSDLVIKGKIVSVTDFDYYDTVGYTLSGHKFDPIEAGYLIRRFKLYTLVVNDKYKFVTGMVDTIRIITGYGHGDCGYNFELDKEYIVYGSTWKENTISTQRKRKKEKRIAIKTIIPNTFSTNICTMTQLANSQETEKLRRLTQ